MYLSIITATYNRGYIIGNLYKSLEIQTIKDFEWIIVDDGSKDDTESLYKKWIQQNKLFDIKYIKQNNGGKHRALNRGIKEAKGDYIIIVDSDDYLESNAIELILKWINSIKNEEKIGAVAGNKKFENGKMIGNYPRNRLYIDCYYTKRKKYKIKGDKSEVFKRELLLKFPFKEFENENFLPESTVWNKIAEAGYKIRYFPENICICRYLEDGLTKNIKNLILNNFKGYTYYEKINYKTLSFPYNYLAISRFITIAKQKK